MSRADWRITLQGSSLRDSPFFLHAMQPRSADVSYHYLSLVPSICYDPPPLATTAIMASENWSMTKMQDAGDTIENVLETSTEFLHFANNALVNHFDDNVRVILERFHDLTGDDSSKLPPNLKAAALAANAATEGYMDDVTGDDTVTKRMEELNGRYEKMITLEFASILGTAKARAFAAKPIVQKFSESFHEAQQAVLNLHDVVAKRLGDGWYNLSQSHSRESILAPSEVFAHNLMVFNKMFDYVILLCNLRSIEIDNSNVEAARVRLEKDPSYTQALKQFAALHKWSDDTKEPGREGGDYGGAVLIRNHCRS